MGTEDETPRLPLAASRVDVELRPSAWPSFAALVTLHGEHDLTTSESIRRALGPLYGNVLVDLSHCSFIDSTVISALLAKHHELDREAHRLELLVSPANPMIARTLALLGLDALLVVHHSTDDARRS